MNRKALVIWFALFTLLVARDALSAPGDRLSSDYPSIQAAVDAGEGVVRVPPGIHVLHAPLVLPNTDLVGRGGVRLVGAGRLTTYLVAASDFTGPAMIRRAPADYVLMKRRSWGLHVSGFTLVLPHADAAGILVSRTDPGYPATYEKATITVEDLGCETLTDYRHVCVQLQGMVHDAVITDLDLDPGALPGSSQPFDSIAILADDGLDNGLDDGGVYSGRFTGITTTPRRGGGGAVFSGRCQSCQFRDIFVGRGTLGTPTIRLTGSWGVEILGLVTEGRLERAQLEFVDSRDIRVGSTILGTPDAGGGVGVDLINCDDCDITTTAHQDKVLWTTARLRIDSASNATRYRIMSGGNNWGTESPTSAVVNAGTGTTGKVINAKTGQIWETM